MKFEDQCRFKYLLNSASIGYANKLKSLLLCGSVVLYVRDGMRHKVAKLNHGYTHCGSTHWGYTHMALFTMALPTVALHTMALLTVVLLTMALLTYGALAGCRAALATLTVASLSKF